MRHLIVPALSALVFILFAAGLPAQIDAERAFHRGSELFQSADFESAAKAWEEALAAGASGPAAHFNLGTAYLRLKRNGPALHQLMLAERHAPRDEDVANNLSAARKRLNLKSGEDERPALLRYLLWVHEKTTPKESLAIFASIWGLIFLLLLSRIIWRRPRLNLLVITLAVLGLAVAFSLTARHYGWWQQELGVVLENATAFTGPSETTHQPHFELEEGDEVRVLEERRGWLKVQAGKDGIQGFVPKSKLGLIP